MKAFAKTLLLTASVASIVSTPAITLTGTVRDFHYFNTSEPPLAGHIDFENAGGFDPGIVEDTIGPDRKPVYTGEAGNPTTHGADAFNQWYNDTPGVNLSTVYAIDLTETAPNSGIYSYQNFNFFPIDNQLGGNQGNPSHNYGFTYELHTTFTYAAGQTFNFTGDDDVWVFINDKLVIDLGGVHAAMSASVDLDTLGLTAGNIYNFDFFFAERHTTESNLKIETSIPLVSTVPDGGMTVAMLGLGSLALGLIRRKRA